MQRNWPPDHFLIQTLIAFFNAPAHTANVLFAVAESHLSLGKALRWGSCSHIEHRFAWDFDVVFLKGKKQDLTLFSRILHYEVLDDSDWT